MELPSTGKIPQEITALIPEAEPIQMFQGTKMSLYQEWNKIQDLHILSREANHQVTSHQDLNLLDTIALHPIPNHPILLQEAVVEAAEVATDLPAVVEVGPVQAAQEEDVKF